MSNYNYDPYGYGYPPRPQFPSDVDPMGQSNNSSVYPPILNPSHAPLRPWNSNSAHYPNFDSPPGPPPPSDHHYHSLSLQYQSHLPTQPQSHYPPSHPSSYPSLSPSNSFLYHEPPPHQQQPIVKPPDPSPGPSGPYHYRPAEPFQYQQYGSFQHGDHSEELRIPPPHSIEFQNMYGGGGYGNSLSSVSNRADHLDNSHSSSSSTYPLDSLLNDMNLSALEAPRPQPQLLPTQSDHFSAHQSHHYSGSASLNDYHRHSHSGSFSIPSPYSIPASPSNSHHQYSGGESQNSHSIQDLVPFQHLNVSLKVLLLHGNLDITVTKARNLPNLDMFSRRLADIFDLVKSKATSITSDPYVAISVADAVIARTYVISNNENPVWNQHFNVPVAHHSAEVMFTVKDNDMIGSQIIGTVKIPSEKIYEGSRVDGTYSVLGSNGKECKRGATLSLSIQYIPVEKLSMYHRGIDYELENGGVPGTYFPLRIGGRVKLYQDAHVPWGSLPPVMMGGGMQYEHGQCWRDIYEAIKNARRLIYITGWSVYHNVRLVRGSNDGSDCTLGELLKAKSQQGVRVLLLIWDDPTSRSIMGYQKEGMMQTHDEETRRFFKHSSVHVELCLRSGKQHSWAKKLETGIIYTHHQKTVVLDSDAGNGYREITAFVGGLDLCDGRYDTPEHSIFRTLKTIHKDDIHNPTFLTNVGGPREPWHDLHSRIEGPAAYDVLKNFEQRWLKVSKPHAIDKLTKSRDDKLLNIREMPDILKMEQCHYRYNNDPENWHVQIFRSIDSNSVKGFPKDPKDATNKNLVCGKNVLIDMSIHTAYVKAIRTAQHFIYIENQYFLGSSFNWSSHQDLGANNLIPMEIALKIACKIKSNERFSVYIIIPMWPEGNPTEMATQRILYWQNQTMQMMYQVIYDALVEVGRENEFVPQDYLNFFCLGNREVLDGDSSSLDTTEANAPNVHSQKTRRFMIYVHSKGMIVDDEYIIVGSANINQRSLEGLRDTEIAMGAYQPEHTWERKLGGPLGQIHAYRMSLWAEHLGVVEESFYNPSSIECMRRIRTLGELNWKQYIADDVTEMRSHLMKYPVDVDQKGKMKPLEGSESFPDVGGHICGSFSVIQENATI